MFRMLTDGEVERIAEAVVAVLERVGLHCGNQAILKALEGAGARVDFSAQVARFPRRVTEDFVAGLRKEDKSEWHAFMRGGNEQVLYSGYQPYRPPAEFRAPPPLYLFHELSTFFHDDETGDRRLGNQGDFITLIKLGDQLNPAKGSGHSLNLSGDTPAAIEPLVAARTLIANSVNPTGVYVLDVRQIPYLQEIQAIAGIANPYFPWMANIICNSPLKMDGKVGDRLVYMVKNGIDPIKVSGMPVGGINMPITAAGSVVILAAEFLVMWLAARALGSKAPLTGMPCSGTMDLANGDVNFVALDAARTRVTLCQFLKHWTGVVCSPGPGEWSPTKTPGMYCTLEKAYFAMVAAAFSGYHPDIGVGHIEAGLAISPAQVVLDGEFTEGLKFLEPPPVNDATLGLDAILELGFGLRGDYLSHPHTLEHMRSATWMPRCFSRNGWSPDLEQAALTKARARVKELVAAHRPPSGKEDQLARIDQVIERAKRALC